MIGRSSASALVDGPALVGVLGLGTGIAGARVWRRCHCSAEVGPLREVSSVGLGEPQPTLCVN
jgi:hypothetical protein